MMMGVRAPRFFVPLVGERGHAHPINRIDDSPLNLSFSSLLLLLCPRGGSWRPPTSQALIARERHNRPNNGHHQQPPSRLSRTSLL